MDLSLNRIDSAYSMKYPFIESGVPGIDSKEDMPDLKKKQRGVFRPVEQGEVEDRVIITDENGMRDPIVFTNNFKDIEIVESVIRYLQEQLARDVKDLENKKYDRTMRVKEYKKNSLVATGASIAIPPVVSLLTGLQNQRMDTIFGEMNGVIGFSISMIPALIVASQLLMTYGLTLRPSKSSIMGKEEKIKYEEELIAELTDDLVKLKLDTNSDKLLEYKANNRGIIDDSTIMKFVKDSIGLRYAFGSQFKRIMKLYNNGQLYEYLLDTGIEEQAAKDFIEFVDAYVHDVNLEGELVKGM